MLRPSLQVKLTLAFVFLLFAGQSRGDERTLPTRTELDDYIAKPDPSYVWKIAHTMPLDGATAYILELTSQTWRSKPEVDRPLWQHTLTIVKPADLKHQTAYLMIGGGRNGNPPAKKVNPSLVLMAKSTNSVVAELGQIPNQPLVFMGDGKPRVEDDLIAYCWVKYMETLDATWLPRLPMVKSVVRAMDATTECLASDAGGGVKVTKFVIAGGSKRGWTTWLTALDPRVVAIVPAVIDILNVRTSMNHHYCAYGFWAPAIGDYVRHKITDRNDDPAYARLLELVDPYNYRHRITQPKFLVNAAGDQFFLPDSSQFYFDELQGPKYIRYVANADHSLRNSDALLSIQAFYHAILTDSPLPKFTWKVQEDGSIRVQTQDRPTDVVLWQATNAKARDFRLETLGPVYKKSKLEPQGDGVYVVKVEKPPAGWTAFFAELTFPSGKAVPFKFTTQVKVIPDVLPHRLENSKSTGTGR